MTDEEPQTEKQTLGVSTLLPEPAARRLLRAYEQAVKLDKNDVKRRSLIDQAIFEVVCFWPEFFRDGARGV